MFILPGGKKQIVQWNRIWGPEIELYIYIYIYIYIHTYTHTHMETNFLQRYKVSQWRKDIFSINGVKNLTYIPK